VQALFSRVGCTDAVRSGENLARRGIYTALNQCCYFNSEVSTFTLRLSFFSEEVTSMSVLAKAMSANFVRLRDAVFCCQCEIISENNTPNCLACGSRAVLNLSRTLGGSLYGSSTARLIADSELDDLVRELISTVSATGQDVVAPRNFGSGVARSSMAPKSEPAHPLLQSSDLDLAEFDLEPTMSLIAERAQTITAATGAAVALRRGRDIVCRARTGRTAPDLGVRLQTHSGLSAKAVQTGQVLLCSDAESNPHVDLLSCRRLGVRSVLVAPLRYFRRTLGLFEVLSSAPYAFDQRDIGTMQMLSSIMVTAISRRARQARR
jgi:GAF domain-containing protein